MLVTAVTPSVAALGDLGDGVKYYETSDGARYPRLQHLSVEDLFAGRRVDYPDAAKHRVNLLPGTPEEAVPETLPLNFDAEPLARQDFILQGQTRKRKTVKASLPLGFQNQKAPKASKRSWEKPARRGFAKGPIPESTVRSALRDA